MAMARANKQAQLRNNITLVRSIKLLPKHMATTYRCLCYLPALRSSKLVTEPRKTLSPRAVDDWWIERVFLGRLPIFKELLRES